MNTPPPVAWEVQLPAGLARGLDRVGEHFGMDRSELTTHLLRYAVKWTESFDGLETGGTRQVL